MNVDGGVEGAGAGAAASGPMVHPDSGAGLASAVHFCTACLAGVSAVGPIDVTVEGAADGAECVGTIDAVPAEALDGAAVVVATSGSHASIVNAT